MEDYNGDGRVDGFDQALFDSYYGSDDDSSPSPGPRRRKGGREGSELDRYLKNKKIDDETFKNARRDYIMNSIVSLILNVLLITGMIWFCSTLKDDDGTTVFTYIIPAGVIIFLIYRFLKGQSRDSESYEKIRARYLLSKTNKKEQSPEKVTDDK